MAKKQLDRTKEIEYRRKTDIPDVTQSLVANIIADQKVLSFQQTVWYWNQRVTFVFGNGVVVPMREWPRVDHKHMNGAMYIFRTKEDAETMLDHFAKFSEEKRQQIQDEYKVEVACDTLDNLRRRYEISLFCTLEFKEG